MSPVVRNILAVIAGLMIGSIVNMALIMIGGAVIPAPPGADVTTMDGLRESMHLFGPRHFVFPFLAHSLGTLVGAYAAAKVAATHKMKFAMAIACFFLIGGVYNLVSLPSPLWFGILDIVAYLPMGYLGGRTALKFTEKK